MCKSVSFWIFSIVPVVNLSILTLIPPCLIYYSILCNSSQCNINLACLLFSKPALVSVCPLHFSVNFRASFLIFTHACLHMHGQACTHTTLQVILFKMHLIYGSIWEEVIPLESFNPCIWNIFPFQKLILLWYNSHKLHPFEMFNLLNLTDVCISSWSHHDNQNVKSLSSSKDPHIPLQSVPPSTSFRR